MIEVYNPLMISLIYYIYIIKQYSGMIVYGGVRTYMYTLVF